MFLKFLLLLVSAFSQTPHFWLQTTLGSKAIWGAKPGARRDKRCQPELGYPWFLNTPGWCLSIRTVAFAGPRPGPGHALYGETEKL